MSRRIRSSSASSRTARRGRSSSALEAHEPPDERVVTRVRGVAVLAPQQLVEAALGRRKRIADVEAEAAEARRADRDQERLARLDPSLEVGEPLLDELRPGQGFEKRGLVHPSNATA